MYISGIFLAKATYQPFDQGILSLSSDSDADDEELESSPPSSFSKPELLEPLLSAATIFFSPSTSSSSSLLCASTDILRLKQGTFNVKKRCFLRGKNIFPPVLQVYPREPYPPDAADCGEYCQLPVEAEVAGVGVADAARAVLADLEHGERLCRIYPF